MNNLTQQTFRKILTENPSTLATKALERASNIRRPRAGTPHEWEDYERYLKEFEKERSD